MHSYWRTVTNKFEKKRPTSKTLNWILRLPCFAHVWLCNGLPRGVVSDAICCMSSHCLLACLSICLFVFLFVVLWCTTTLAVFFCQHKSRFVLSESYGKRRPFLATLKGGCCQCLIEEAQFYSKPNWCCFLLPSLLSRTYGHDQTGLYGQR